MVFKTANYNYKDLKIMHNNPRLIDSSKIDFFELNLNDYNFDDIIKNTLKYENEFEEFLELMEQLSYGYNPALDQIIVLQNQNAVFVLEGNRRVIAINFLKNYDLCKNIIELFIANVELSQKTINNCRKIVDISRRGPINDNYTNIAVMCVNVLEIDEADIEDTIREIWSVIFTRHAGENKGKKPWTRAMYFVNLKNFYKLKQYKKYDYIDILNELSRIFNKSLSTIKLDIDHANRVLKIFEFAGEEILSPENKIKFNNHISALELSFSMIKIRTIDGTQKTLSNVCDLKFDNEKWSISSDKVDMKNLCKFLLKNVGAFFNTRGWENEHYSILKEFIINNVDNPSMKVGDFKTLQTYYKESLIKPENKRDDLEKEIILFYSNLTIVSKEVQKDRFKKLIVNDFISKSILKLWIDNIGLMFNLFQEREKENFPFLIGATIIRSIEELIATFLFVYNIKWRDWIREYEGNTDVENLQNCIDVESCKNKILSSNDFVYKVFKRKVNHLNIRTDEHAIIIESLSNVDNWENDFQFIAENKRFSTWIRLISKYASGDLLNEIIHRYYCILENPKKLSNYYNAISNLIKDIHDFINTLFQP